MLFLLVAVLTGFNVVGIDLTALRCFPARWVWASVSAFRKIVSNLISGIILLLDKSIKAG